MQIETQLFLPLLKKWILALLITASICTVSNSFAKSTVEAGSLILGKFNHNSKIDRLEIAQDLLKKINSLNSHISNPTPDELNWINAERKESKKSLDRYARFVDSPEFQKFKLKEYIKAMQDSLQCVINNIKINNTPKEMYCWEYVSYLLVDQDTINDSIKILQSNNKISRYLGKYEDNGLNPVHNPHGYSGFYHSEGEGIMRYIIMPYLSGNITG